MTVEMQNSGRRVDCSVARSQLSLALCGLYIHCRNKNMWVSFGRFWSVSVGFGRFQTVSEVSGALRGATRRVLSVKC